MNKICKVSEQFASLVFTLISQANYKENLQLNDESQTEEVETEIVPPHQQARDYILALINFEVKN
ncbi:hypothetical protein J8Y17_02885 [Bacillus cereus]|uniref:hypothetical protein n=1 Tax=Bacillus cereus group TaxID=86661 RepID=UPI0011309DEF|nr:MULTISPECIES: hypothetical protein [Bacillus cereus group]MBE3644760.1 hypothetical protein [Bacillus anthracis]MDA2056682.1 hypothetical protein [Bacillus cereus]MDD0819765.1 hypothetical protein [Bacillus cereus]QUW32230.1 hypothetical protein J8Y17_02885 [Bacillus cereus]WIG22502.1 hypothetical protein QPL80_03385 [Bacillus anthracis]